MRKSNGIRPNIGVNWGQTPRVPDCGDPDRTLKNKPAPIAPVTSAVINAVRPFTASSYCHWALNRMP
jgi:hypothetical protein